MATIFIEGFDKYGPAGMDVAGTYPTLVSAMAGEWTSFGTATAGRIFVVAGLSATGNAIQLGAAAGATLTKTLSANFARIIGGFRFKTDLGNGSQSGVQFLDGVNAQFSIVFNQSTGTTSIRSAGPTGTLIATSAVSFSTNTIHYLEWDVTIGTAAAYNVYLDGVSIMSGTGNTRAGSTNNFVNGMTVGNLSGSNMQIFVIDDLYLADNTGGVGITAPLLSSPRVETTYPTSDGTVQFTFGAGTVGKPYAATANTNAPGANELFLVKVSPSASGTLQSVSIMPQTTNGTAKFKAVAYSDSAGSPNTLLSSGTEVVGCTTGTLLTGALVTPQSLTGGTSYWIGFITDTSIALQETDATLLGQKAANTYGSGAPGTAPAMTAGQNTWMVYGNLTAVATNTPEVNGQYVPGTQDASFVTSSTAANEDLYNFGALSVTPTSIYTVSVKAFARKTDSGARTISLDLKSSATDSTGSLASQALATSYQWQSSYFDQDPNGSIAWTGANLNSATSGFKVAT